MPNRIPHHYDVPFLSLTGIDMKGFYWKHDSHLARLASDAAHEGAALGRVRTAL